jgi:glycosyltransferase involved in cell wall biosynthesis
MPDEKKKILIVTRAFYPGNSPRAHRATELAKELSRQGHAVSVLAPKAHELEDFASTYSITLLDLGEPTWPDVPAVWRGQPNLFLRGLRAFLVKFLSYPALGWTFRVANRLPAERAYDGMISIAAPHSVHWGVALASVLRRKPAVTWIADCGDPFMGMENSGFYTHPAFYFRWVEKMFCRAADWITVPTEGAKQGYYREFQDKLAVIPQGFRFEDYEHLRGTKRESGLPRFVYAGGVIPGKRDPRVLIEFLRNCDTEFEFHIFTRQGDILQPCLRGDPRIFLHEFVPRDKLLPQLASMDFLVNFENVGSIQTPSKLIDYWLCGRPVLSLRSYDLDASLVDQFLEGDYRNALVIDRPEQYGIENVVDRFMALV